MMVASARERGIVMSDRTMAELSRGDPLQGTALVTQEIATTTQAHRGAIMTTLERAGINGLADRQIVQQALLSETAPQVIPTLATADRQVINGLARLAGINPAHLGRYRTVAEYIHYVRHTATFEVLIEGRRLIVIPIQAVRSGI